MADTGKPQSEDNCIRLKIENWDELGDYVPRTVKTNYYGFLWKLKAYKNEEGDIGISLYIDKEEEATLWFCLATIDFFLINQNEGGEDHRLLRIENNRFCSEESNEGVGGYRLNKHMGEDLLKDPKMGFLKENIIIVEARISVHSIPANKFRRRIQYDPLTPSRNSDGILMIEGQKVYVSKQLLSIHSAFFDRLFEEAAEAESELQDVNLEDFKTLLKFVYPTGELINDDNVELLLRLAYRFEMTRILDNAEFYLMNDDDDDFELNEKFRWADQYNLVVLLDQLLPMYTAELIIELKESPEYEMLKKETKDLLFEKYIEFTAAKMD